MAKAARLGVLVRVMVARLIAWQFAHDETLVLVFLLRFPDTGKLGCKGD